MSARILLTFSLCCFLIGCSGGQQPENSESPSTTGTKDSTTAKSKGGPRQNEIDEEESKKQVRELFGDLELKAWPKISADKIGETLKPETIQKIIGVEHPVTAKKSSFSPQWKYSWASPDKKQKGSVSVELIMENQPESQMMIQAKVRLDMVKQGFAEEVDLKKYGVVGVLRTKKGTNDLQICTKSKMIIINTKNMQGRDFTDEAAKKKAAVAIAGALFDGFVE